MKIPSYKSRTAALMISTISVLPALSSPDDVDRADFNRVAPAGQIVYQYTGRVKLDFIAGTGVVFGYFTQFAAAPPESSLFGGAPGESTAFFTFRANISFQPLPGNGDIGGGAFAVTPVLISPGDFSVYFSPDPHHDWANPDTFSDGELIATFSRQLEQMSLLGPIATNTASAALKSSSAFEFGGREIRFSRVVPSGITNITSGPTMPLPGSTPTSPTFAFAGYGLAIGR